MQRNKRTIPPYIRNLTPSQHKKGMFDITWDDITYTMPLELANSLANYFKTFYKQQVSVASWLEQLPPEQNKLVEQTKRH